MSRFLIFSHSEKGMRRSEVVGTEADVRLEARLHELLDDEQIYDVIETDCQESGKRLRQVESVIHKTKRGRW
jgi:hypothetical protein